MKQGTLPCPGAGITPACAQQTLQDVMKQELNQNWHEKCTSFAPF